MRQKQHGYGFFPGGDPRDFTPDPECCSKKEIEAWKEACASWDRGEKVVCEGSHRWITDKDGNVIGTATVSSFGIGVYTYEYDDEEESA